MVRRRKKEIELTETPTEKVKSYPVGEMIFNSRKDYTYFLKLEELQKEGLIESFDPTSLLFIENASENKFNAKKIIINDLKLDSRLEADYYLYLLSLKREGEVVDFELHPPFILQPPFVKNGKKIGAIKYIADFAVTYPDGRIEIVDTKGMITPDFALKKKIFEYTFPEYHLRVLKYVVSMGGWIEFDDWNKLKKEKKKKIKK